MPFYASENRTKKGQNDFTISDLSICEDFINFQIFFHKVKYFLIILFLHHSMDSKKMVVDHFFVEKVKNIYYIV